MPTVRIRTHDPESVSFFTSKLADSGFDVEFAAPGQRVRGEVDLEITVNYSKKSQAGRKQLRNASATPAARIEWTTPYHVDAPELEDELRSEAGKRDVSRDRALARILTGASNHDDMFVVGEQEDAQPEVLAPPQEQIEVPAPKPHSAAAVSRPLPPVPPRETRRPAQGRAPVIKRSFLQRNAASATAIILAAAVVIFYLSFFGTSSSAAQPAAQPPSTQTAVPAPVTAPPAPATDLMTTSTSSAPASSETESTDRATPHKHSTRRHHRDRLAKAVAPSDEPEVTVRHFLTWPDKEAAKPRADR